MVSRGALERMMRKAVIALAAVGLLSGLAAAASAQDSNAPTRPRIIIHPRAGEPGPHAKRHCRSWLAQEYRVSGPVIVPRMQCWWQ